MSQARDITSDLSDRATPPRHPRSTPHFDKGCSVSPGERWGGGGAGAVAVLAVHFPMLSADDLSHIIDTCGGDIDWAANVLLDAGYGEEGREGREGREGPTGGAGEAEEHTNMGLVMDALLETGLGEEAGLEEAGLEEAGLGEEAGLEEAGLEEAELREAGRAVESAAPVGGLSGCEECGACPPLLCLSHSALQSAQRVVTTELREALVANSLLRLRSVESFHSRRRRVESTDSTLTLHLPTALITQLTAMFGRGRTQPGQSPPKPNTHPGQSPHTHPGQSPHTHPGQPPTRGTRFTSLLTSHIHVSVTLSIFLGLTNFPILFLILQL